MTISVAAMLLGVFVVPAGLLWLGHRLRRRSVRWHGVFWGALLGHLVALVVGTVFALMPAEAWAPTDVLRGALALWSFLVLPLIGALIGALRGSAQRT